MTLSVHPTYDPTDKIWFTDDGLTARSLAELQRKLPDTEIKGYCPNGFGNVVRPRPPEVVKITLREERTIRAKAKREVQGRRPIIQREEKPLVISEVGGLRTPRARYYPRERGIRSPSAFPKVDWTLSSNQEVLRGLVGEKLSSQQIGDRMGCSRNAIIGACSRLGYDLNHKVGRKFNR